MVYKNSYLDVEPSQWESLFKTHLLYSSAEFLLLSGNIWSSRPWPHIVDPLYLSMPPEVKWAIVPAILKSSSFSKSKKLCLALCISPLQFLRKLILCNVVSIFFGTMIIDVWYKEHLFQFMQVLWQNYASIDHDIVVHAYVWDVRYFTVTDNCNKLFPWQQSLLYAYI